MQPTDPILEHFRPNPLQRRGLERLGLETVADLLWHFPNRYAAPGLQKSIATLTVGEQVVIYGQVTKSRITRGWKKRIPIGEIKIEDATGSIKAIWFHQAFLAKKVAGGSYARLSGKVAERRGEKYLANPEIESAANVPPPESLFTTNSDPTLTLTPVYPETRGLSSSWLEHAIKKLISHNLHETLIDPLPTALLEKYNLPTLASSLVWIHAPRTDKDTTRARKRFAFQEIFFIQLSRWRDRLNYQANGAWPIATKKTEVEEFIKRFPFAATVAQKRAIDQILKDFNQTAPMTRLLEGDVGSGKTAVAATTAYAAVRAGREVAYMAPTEILARQHFESFIGYFRHLPGVQVALITGSGCYKFPSKINPGGYTNISRPQLLKWVANGEIKIVVGTHTLIQETVKFKNLAYVIIDEQHRFGVMQRARLARKQASRAPHLLSMTATPIPRTLALSIYGDLDLSLLDELPAGRKPVITETVAESGRARAYEHIRQELAAGRQAYVICPRIDEPDPTKELALQVKSATAERERLATQIFPDYEVALVHSKLKSADKEKVMAQFARGDAQILVATSVVEVGVNVPNATMIIIEGAERFGLAQLHQLRGRVLRSSAQAHCYLFTSKPGGHESARLKALVTAKNGFELAEIDLQLRGAGALSGGQQWGLSDVGMEAIKNLKMVEAARTEARSLIEADPTLQTHPELAKALNRRTQNIHFE